ncbi:MAG: hypothetical protein IKC48_02735 [Clostridia bacterium]|nr:hypothetical protein [Clostridia bacterium]
MTKKEILSMTQEEFQEGLSDIIAEIEEKIDIRIRVDKKFVDDRNSKIKRVGNYKSKILSYNNYPSAGAPSSLKMSYSELGAKNLGDLMENRDKYVRDMLYAYVLSENFPERESAIRSEFYKEYCNYGWPVYPLVGAIVGLFFEWWVAICLGTLGLALGLAVFRFVRNSEKYKLCSKKHTVLKNARKYVETALSLMNEEERQKINLLKLNFNTKKHMREFEQRKIAVLNTQIDALSRSDNSEKVSDSKDLAREDGTDSGRREVFDMYGRTQGYVEDGRLYDNKSDLIGYIDSENRVYDKSNSRKGEVGSDGKITQYK